MTSRGIVIPRSFTAALLIVAPFVAHGQGVALLESRVESIEAAAWRASGLTASVELTEDGIRGEVRIAELAVPEADLKLAATSVRCGSVRLTAQEFRCDDALLSADFPGIGRQDVPGWFVHDRQSGRTRATLSRVPVAGGELHLQADVDGDFLSMEFRGEGLQLEALLGVAGDVGFDLADMTAGGAVSGSGSFRSAADGSLTANVSATLDGSSVSNAAGTAVAADLNGRLEVGARYDDKGWLFDAAVETNAGEVYVEPVYANASEHAMQFTASAVRTSDFRSFSIGEFSLRQDTLLDVAGRLDVAIPESEDAPVDFDGRIDITDTSVNAVYTSLLQVLAAGTILGDLETAGRLTGSVTFAAGAPDSATLDFDDIALDDRERRFAVYGLAGHVHWPGTAGEAGSTRLRWDGAVAYNIPLGAAAIEVELDGNDVELLSPLRLPTMGGALVVNRLAMRDYGTESASGLLDAELEPIELGQLSAAFGWPAFSGSLSGRLPLLQYEGNEMAVGGRLTARAFDGDIEIANLRLEQPFGRVPRLYGDLSLRRLDLERITNTFSFGLIQGRLSGDLTGLAMLNWRPVTMDLHLYTPPDDDSRHRISQRAVENLASVGGGGGAAIALSSGFLKFFEVFAYDRIGLRCVLKDGTCAMSGAGDAGESPVGDGYYIVKGSGLPRIDVIGYRRQVNWEQLLSQLASITRSDSPIIN